MTATAGEDELSNDVEGRRRRGRILLVIAASVLVIGFVASRLIERRNDQRLDDLSSDLETSFVDTTSADFVLLWADAVVDPGSDDSFLEALTSDGGVAPDAATVDNDVVLARYPVDSLGGARCIRVSWTATGPTYDEGSGRQCSTPVLG